MILPNLSVIDDSKDYSHAIQHALQKYFSIQTFESSAEFLRALDAGHQANIVLTDHQMKDMNGVELCSRLRQDGHLFPIILISAWIDKQVALEAMAAGANDLLEKPISIEQLRGSLNRSLALDNRWSTFRDAVEKFWALTDAMASLLSSHEARYTLAENTLYSLLPKMQGSDEERREFLRLVREGTAIHREVEAKHKEVISALSICPPLLRETMRGRIREFDRNQDEINTV